MASGKTSQREDMVTHSGLVKILQTHLPHARFLAETRHCLVSSKDVYFKRLELKAELTQQN